MKHILIDWSLVKVEEDFYNIFLPQVKAPEWHGRNLAALSDSLVTGQINSIEPPYIIHNINLVKTLDDIIEFQLEVLSIFNESVLENRGIKVINE